MERRIEVFCGDITRVRVDAIVNAANRTLLGGGGVDGAIHRAAGPELLDACRKLGGCETGEAKITGGFRLPSRYIIHAVGPVWRGGDLNEEELLASCYQRSMILATEHHCKTIGFPNISTGIYRFPKETAATIAIREVLKYLNLHSIPERVIFICFDRENFELYERMLNLPKGGIKSCPEISGTE